MRRYSSASLFCTAALVFSYVFQASLGLAQTAPSPAQRAAVKSDIADQVMKLLQAKFSEAIILKKIAQVNTPVTLTTDQMVALKGAGASDAVFAALEDPKLAQGGRATVSGPTTVVVTPPPPPSSFGGKPTTSTTTTTVTTTTVTKPSMKQRAMIMVVCGGGAIGGFKLGEKLADQQAANMHLTPAQAAALRHKYEIGLALALCKGGKMLAGTVYANLSKKDQEARQKDIDSALADAQPGTRNYVVPDHPDMKGTHYHSRGC